MAPAPANDGELELRLRVSSLKISSFSQRKLLPFFVTFVILFLTISICRSMDIRSGSGHPGGSMVFSLPSDDFVRDAARVQGKGKQFSSGRFSDMVLGPIDLVFTWVNGSDPAFVQDLVKYGKKNSAGRYRDYDTLRYALRSVERYAPWFGTIYLVTNGQVPSWLNPKFLEDLGGSPRFELVTHSQIFEDLADLPTFSSHPIESSMHRIPGLSERFLYCNDDMLFANNIYPADVWVEPDKTVVYRSKEKIPAAHEMPSSIWKQALIHSNFVLNRDPLIPEKPTRHYAMHHCYSFRKSVLREMSYRFRSEYLETRQRRFRAGTDITIPFLYANYVEHADVPYELRTESDFVYSEVTNNIDSVKSRFETIRRARPKFTCFQDMFGPEGPSLEMERFLSDWFSSQYSKKSRWER